MAAASTLVLSGSGRLGALEHAYPGAGAVFVGVCVHGVIGLPGFAVGLMVSHGTRMASGNARKWWFLPFYFTHRKFLAFAD